MHKLSSRFVGSLLALSVVGLSSTAMAQEFSVSSETAFVGDTTVTVDWTYTAGASVQGIGVDIEFNEALLTPVATGADVDNCVADATANQSSCEVIATDTIRVSLLNFGDPLDTQGGTITFTIAETASDGDSSPMNLTLASVTPTASVELGTEGGVSITSGPQSQLALTPDPLAFGTVDLGNMPVTESFTLSNEGEEDALNIDVSLAGPDTEFSIASNGCDSTLAAGADCTITIQFDAADNGDYTNAINITSDADVNPNPSAGITGSADSVASLSVSPDFGPVDLGTVLIDTTGTANGTLSNSGSADGDFSCTLTGDSEISTDPSPLSGTVPAGDSVGFSISCAVPDTAEDGDSYSAVLECTGDNDFGGTHEISCDATEFEAVPVPTLANWSIVLFALMMLLVGGFSIRFFRT